MAATVSDGEVREWMALLERYLSRYRGHHQFEDLLAEGYRGMAEALTKHDPERGANVKSFALGAGYQRAVSWFRSTQNETRRWNRHGGEVPEILRLGDLDEHTWSAVEPDFAPALIEYLAARERWSRMPDAKRRAIRMVCQGYTRNEIIAALGLTWRGYWRLLQQEEQSSRQPAKSRALRHRPCRNQCGFRGVGLDKKFKHPRYRTQISVHGQLIALATWPTAEEAALIYDAALLHYHGGDGQFNLLPDEYKNEGGDSESGGVTEEGESI